MRIRPNPKPFVWTKSADEILASIARFAQRTVDARAAQHLSRTTGQDTRNRSGVGFAAGYECAGLRLRPVFL